MNFGYQDSPKRRDNMAISYIKATFPTTIENVWAIVTSLTDYSWRSDIDKIEVVNDTTFIEYSKTGIATTFTITVCNPLERWEFDMENKNMKGHWVGIFKPKNGYVEIDFTENVSAKKFLLKPFVKTYLKKQQSTYVHDLGKALANSKLIDVSIIDYKEHSLGAGSEAEAAAYVYMSRNDIHKKTFGVGVDSNITRASIKSVISALNRLYGK